MSHQAVIEQLLLSLRRSLSYLARRTRRGRQTTYDEVLERDLEALARACSATIIIAVRIDSPKILLLTGHCLTSNVPRSL